MNQANDNNAFTKAVAILIWHLRTCIYLASLGLDGTINYFDVTENLGDSPVQQRFSVSGDSWTNATNAAQGGTTDHGEWAAPASMASWRRWYSTLGSPWFAAPVLAELRYVKV